MLTQPLKPPGALFAPGFATITSFTTPTSFSVLLQYTNSGGTLALDTIVDETTTDLLSLQSRRRKNGNSTNQKMKMSTKRKKRPLLLQPQMRSDELK